MSFIAREVVVTAGEGEVVTALGSRNVYKLLGHHTGGAFSLVEETLLDSDGPPLHVHEYEEETFYVLDGRGLFVLARPSGSSGAATWWWCRAGFRTPSRREGLTRCGCS